MGARTDTLPTRVAQLLRDVQGGDGKAAVVALFRGASGTGKTLAATQLASALDRALMNVESDRVHAKYIGETEKYLDRIFDAAQSSGAVLFFEEADALFGKRSDVKDAHDRYANVEVSYLLQKLERFDGLVIVATNQREDVDPAFAARIAHIIDFPPD